MIIFILVLAYSILLVLVPGSRLSLLKINGMNHPMVNLYVLLVALIFGMIIYFNQKFVLEKISAKIRKAYPDK